MILRKRVEGNSEDAHLPDIRSSQNDSVVFAWGNMKENPIIAISERGVMLRHESECETITAYTVTVTKAHDRGSKSSPADRIGRAVIGMRDIGIYM